MGKGKKMGDREDRWGTGEKVPGEKKVGRGEARWQEEERSPAGSRWAPGAKGRDGMGERVFFWGGTNRVGGRTR